MFYWQQPHFYFVLSLFLRETQDERQLLFKIQKALGFILPLEELKNRQFLTLAQALFFLYLGMKLVDIFNI